MKLFVFILIYPIFESLFSLFVFCMQEATHGLDKNLEGPLDVLNTGNVSAKFSELIRYIFRKFYGFLMMIFFYDRYFIVFLKFC